MLVIGKIDRRRNLHPARDIVKLIKIMEGKTSATCSVHDRCMKLTQRKHYGATRRHNYRRRRNCVWV